ncbi:MAG TPA: glycosyl hydrolase [Chloroflexota bacterium]|jgi:photosystem II stability/assembly factor-like uncharacterized protein|nr:glycosyl hydrolase [Chloroflexota bacterium]
MSIALFVGTRKGAFVLRSNDRSKWELTGPSYLGHTANHVVLDPRDGRTVLMASHAGHLGPTVYRSTDAGLTWTEAEAPPRFPKVPEGEEALSDLRPDQVRAVAPGRSVAYVFWLTPGHASEPGVWYAGTSPHGLFRTEDGGNTWQGVDGFNENPRRKEWSNNDDPKFAPPGGATTHSISVDPRDKNHLYLGLSTGGVFESVDRGKEWRPVNKGCAGDFLPDPTAEFGHDPHCVRLHPARPDRLYQQNHCGIYRIDRPSNQWVRVGEAMPKEVGDIGFAIDVHPRDPNTAWVFPMDGTDVWPRTSPDGRPAVFATRDAGATWQRQSEGMPARAWWTVYRQSVSADRADPVGVYFGTSNGELWGSSDEGATWRPIAQHLPAIVSVEAAELA